MSITLKYYIKNSDLPFTIFELIAMYIETIFYQKWIKHCEINNKFKIDIIQILIISLFFTDLFLIIAKKKSISTKYLKDDIILYDIFLPILLFIIQIVLFNHIIVIGYYITYTIEKYLFFLLIIFHNIIIIIQGILIHPFMWISLINLFPIIICIYYFWYYEINKSYIWFVIALIFYLCLFIFNLYLIK